MRKPAVGSVFRLAGFRPDAAIQYVGDDGILGEIARVFLVRAGQDDLCAETSTMFVIGFPVRAAAKEGYLQYVARCEVAAAHRSIPFRVPNKRPGTSEIVSWSIFKDGKQTIVRSLDREQRGYPLAYAVNVQKLEELVDRGWDGHEPL